MNFDRYVGLPWRDGGRGFDGVDCYGLVWLFFAHERGVTLRDYSEAYDDAGDRDQTAPLFGEGLEDWRAAEPEPGAVALIRRGRAASHTGIVAPGRRLLHIERRDGFSCLAPMARLHGRIEGFYLPKV